MTTPDFLAAIRDESARFRSALATAGDARVPTCPDWSTEDLLWHLTEVQWFWGSIVTQNVESPAELTHPDRPVDRESLLAAFDDASRALQKSLHQVPAETARWMWTSDEALHTAGYIARRQAHEAIVHRVDSELTTGGAVSGIDPALAADGVDEVVEVMYGREHPDVTFAPTDGLVVELVATDAERRWVLRLGRETGTDPGSGESIDNPTFRPAPNALAVATISGTAADLDLWLWNRPTIGDLGRSGDASALAAIQEVLDEGLQ
jgi:uncharacterized protein (TIGR03083 family)